MPTPADLTTQWRTQAADYLRTAKTYSKCKASEGNRQAYVKAAAQLTRCADQLEQAIGPQERESQGLSQVVLDAALEGQAQAAAGEGAAMPDVPSDGPVHGSDGVRSRDPTSW